MAPFAIKFIRFQTSIKIVFRRLPNLFQLMFQMIASGNTELFSYEKSKLLYYYIFCRRVAQGLTKIIIYLLI
jgi:hypothetical protein